MLAQLVWNAFLLVSPAQYHQQIAPLALNHTSFLTMHVPLTVLLHMLQLMPNVPCVIPHVQPVFQPTRPIVLPVTLDTSFSHLSATLPALLAPILTQQVPVHFALLHATLAQAAQTLALDVSTEVSYSVTPAILLALQHTTKITAPASCASHNVSHVHMALLISALHAHLQSISTIRSPMPAQFHALLHIILLLVVPRSVSLVVSLVKHVALLLQLVELVTQAIF